MKMSSFAKKLVAGIVSVAMVASMAVVSAVSVFAADGTFSLSVDKASAGLGEEVVATISVSEMEFASCDVLVKYDPAVLEYDSVVLVNPVDQKIGTEMCADSPDPEAGTVQIGYIFANKASSGVDGGNKVNGAFLNITFVVLDNAPKTDTAIELVSVSDVRCPDGSGATVDKEVEIDADAPSATVAVDGIVEVKPINLTVSPASAKAGDIVSVTVNMADITFGSLMFEVGYDADALEYVETEEDILAKDDANHMAVVANAVNGKVVVSAMASPNATINGPFVTLQFKVKEGATTGVKPFSVAVTEAYLNTDAGVEDITPAVQEATTTGTVSVEIVAGTPSDTPSGDTPSGDTPSGDTPSGATPGGATPGGTTSGGASGSGSGSGSTPAATGNSAPIAVIAFLSVIALAGVVVFAKKGMTE